MTRLPYCLFISNFIELLKISTKLNMKKLPIPKEKLLNSLFNSTLYTLLEEYVDEPDMKDIRNYITINQEDIINYLNSNPSIAENYLQKFIDLKTQHDIYAIAKISNSYRVYWLDHGKPRFEKKFKNISEAVANHVMLDLGL